ncbi:hypothetical protein [Lysinibacillus sp. FSL P4-0201]|uniref:hypothetical protein n=1 Tax=Lysinibacillus sp. FSL P4-0201 TaxID=2921721 RepID=UPI00315AB265
MDKVKVSRDVADALDHVTRTFSNEAIIYAHVTKPEGWLLDENQALNRISLDMLIRALYIGYEVNETPVERFNYFYDKYSQSDILFEKYFLSGMLAVAKWFDLPVKGREE